MEDGRNWSGLPGDLVVNFLREMHVADAIRSGAVCVSWNHAYSAFRRLRVPSPRQPPCLLYASDDLDLGAAALHCPATGATLRVPFSLDPFPRRPLLGSGDGWLVTVDEASNLHLLNPVTSDQIALPPITAIHHVKMGTDEQGDPAYNVYENLPGDKYNRLEGCYEIDKEPTILDIDQAHLVMYKRAVLSASPSAGRACVILLLHMPYGEVSFVRLGDDSWTWVSPEEGTGLPWRFDYCHAIYSTANGLFYLLRNNASMCSLDLNGPSPVACKVLGSKVMNSLPNFRATTKYLVETPTQDILQVWRSSDDVDLPVDIPPDYRDHEPDHNPCLPDYMDNEGDQNPCIELNTVDLQIYKVDLHGHSVELIKSLPQYALFLGLNDSMCLSVKDFPGLKMNCVYITEDCLEHLNFSKYNRLEIGIWSMAEQGMLKLVDLSRVIYPWLTWPCPIWVKPSLF